MSFEDILILVRGDGEDRETATDGNMNEEDRLAVVDINDPQSLPIERIYYVITSRRVSIDVW